MGFDREAYDRLVKKKRKDLRNQQPDQSGDEYQPSVVNLSHESTKSAEVNPFGVYFQPPSIGMRATHRNDFVDKVRTLEAEITKIKGEMQPIIARLPAEQVWDRRFRARR